jgi:hypothetical protein
MWTYTSTRWRRSLLFLAQVWFYHGDLRRKMPFYALGWRSIDPYFHTCASITSHLRPKCTIPAPD